MPSSASESKPPAWKVISQTEQQGRNPQGNFVPGHLVGYQLASGQVGTVFVPDSTYTPDKVKEAINGAAVNVDAVATLTSDS